MTTHDVIINLVDRLIAEKEKNFALQLKLLAEQNKKDDKTDKD